MGLFRRIKEILFSAPQRVAPPEPSPAPTAEEKVKLAMAAQHVRIFKDSMNLLRETTNPDTFFRRYALAIEKAEIVAEMCEDTELGTRMAQMADTLRYDKDVFVYRFIERCAAAGKLPFVKASILAHSDELTEENLRLLNELLSGN